MTKNNMGEHIIVEQCTKSSRYVEKVEKVDASNKALPFKKRTL